MAIVCLASMTVVGVVVGLRLVALARRTHQLPETLMGAGLLSMATLGAPLAGSGRMPALVGTPLGDGIFAVGLAFVAAGIGCIFAFTWQVFRKQSGLALVAVLLVCGALGATWHGLVSASVGSSMDEVYAHTRPWAMGVVALVALTFGWTAFESLAYHRKLVRRLALGLAEPEIVNRVCLWGMGAAATTLLCLLMLAPMYAGVPPLQNPLSLVVMAVAAAVCSTCWFFAFFPPQTYLERLRDRAAVRSGARPAA